MDSQGPARLSGVILLKSNLLDPLIYVTASASYLFCLVIGYHLSLWAFLVQFAALNWLIHRHIDSYRSFRITRRWASKLDADERLASGFLINNFTDDYKSRLQIRRDKSDSFQWINNIINYFWPYLSHVVHHELNEFLARTRSLARSKKGLKRYLYALVRQLDANILAIEHCELGSRAPFVKSLVVFDEGARDRSLVYDLDFVYEGNMNMSFICRYCCCCSSRMGIKDVFVHLKSRLMIGPIEASGPRIDAISFSLLELPSFGYKGIALVELAELKMAKRSINRLIKDHLLYPKQIRRTMAELQQKAVGNAQANVANTGDKQPAEQDESMADADNSRMPPDRPPLMARILAQLTYCTCICSNGCLRCCCQAGKRREQNERVVES